MIKYFNKNRELKRTKLKAISKIAVFMLLFLFIYYPLSLLQTK